MREIGIDNLHEGMVLPLDLYSAYGIKLLARRTAVSASLLKHLATLGPGFYLAENARGFAALTVLREVQVEDLRRGGPVRNDLVGLGGRITAEAGAVLEAHHLDALAGGAFEVVKREPQHLAATRRDLAQAILDRRRQAWASLDLEVPVAPDALGLEQAEAEPASHWPDIEEISAWRVERVALLRSQYARLLAGLPVHARVFERLADELIEMLRRDPARYAQVALLCPRDADYLPDHAFNTAALGVVIAARRHWPVEHIRLAGLAGLLHDVGMLLLPQRLRLEDEQLDEIDRARVRRHTGYSVSLLHDVEALPETIVCAAYRHHERDNGRGYPEGLRAREIGDPARLLAVADMAAAMNEPRPFRPQPLPHEAIQTLVQYGVDNFIHRPHVRALVESVGLYPIGSHVLLSTRRIALVVGMHFRAPDRPIVRLCDDEGRATGETLDLMKGQPWELFVLDGVPAPAGEAARQVRRAG